MTELVSKRPACASATQVIHGPRAEHVIGITLGESDTPVGELRYIQDGETVCSQFTFASEWLRSGPDVTLSPDLFRHAKAQSKMSTVPGGSAVFAALADTVPDGFARTVVENVWGSGGAEAHPLLSMESTELRSLLLVNDAARIGALRARLKAAAQHVPGDCIDLPGRADLDDMQQACFALERGCASSDQQMLLLRGATSLGGRRPKVSFIDQRGILSVAKLRSVGDQFPVNKAEMLASQIANHVGIHTAELSLVMLRGDHCLVSPRFDRKETGRRLYLTARSLLLAEEGEVISIEQLLRAMRPFCENFAQDARQLWMRFMFRLLLNNLDPSLHKIGFLFSAGNQWQLAPATGIRPATGKKGTLQAPWIRELGPGCSVESLLGLAGLFGVSRADAISILKTMTDALGRWQERAVEYIVRMEPHQIAQMVPVMQNRHFEQARVVISG
jgi:serine/threonine-protein kinase HipA